VDVSENLADPARIMVAGHGRHVFLLGRHLIPCALGTRRGTRAQVKSGAVPVISSPYVRTAARIDPCPGEDGKSPGRTIPCGGADMFWIGSI
jgi:hypothetical protein